MLLPLALLSIKIAVGLFFGLLSAAAARKLYRLLGWTTKRLTTTTSNNNRPAPEDLQLKQSSDAPTWLFFWRKASPLHLHSADNDVSGRSVTEDEDVEMGLGLGAKPSSVEDQGVEAELMRLHNLCGPPRYLFTIKEETLEDLASEDGKTRSRLIDLMRATDVDFMSPIASPVKRKNSSPLLCPNGFLNPLFECSAEAALNRIMSSPPPKFKFLRDAEEKLQRKLEAERQNSMSRAGGQSARTSFEKSSSLSSVLCDPFRFLSGAALAFAALGGM